MRFGSGCLLVLSLPAVAWGQGARDDRWREDVAQLSGVVAANHPNFFTQVTRDRFQQETAALADAVPESSDAEIVLGMQRLLALGADAHTSLAVFQARSAVRRFPLRLYWFSDGVFATDAGASFVSVLGRKLVRIEDTPVEEAIARVVPLISHENEWWVRSQAPALLTSPDVLAFVGVAPRNTASVRYTFEDSGGSPVTVSLQPASVSLVSLPQKARPNPPLYRRYADRYYWFEYLADSAMLYVKYNSCNQSPVLSMSAFVAEMDAFARSQPPGRYVIDLRNNPGGNSTVIYPLVQNLGSAIAAGRLAPGSVYAIIGRDTMSSGNFAAIDIKRLGATLVGEPTGNRPSHFGQVQTFTLTNSQLTAQHSTRKYEFADFPENAIMPDIPVLISSADYFSERDPVLERIK